MVRAAPEGHWRRETMIAIQGSEPYVRGTSVILSDQPANLRMLFRLIRSTVAWGCAGAAGAATAYYLTEAARGTTRGAPGYTKALSTLGKRTGGSMREGMLLLGATAAVSGALVYRIVGPPALANDEGVASGTVDATADSASAEHASES